VPAGTDDNATDSAANNCGDHDTRRSMRLSEPDFAWRWRREQRLVATMMQLSAVFLNVGDPMLNLTAVSPTEDSGTQQQSMLIWCFGHGHLP
jgi:hypothetical protein